MTTTQNPAASTNNVIHTQACVDCAMLLANGDLPEHMDHTETTAWLAEIQRRGEGVTWHLTDKVTEFSWTDCGVCGSALGGSRFSVEGIFDSPEILWDEMEMGMAAFGMGESMREVR